MNRFIRFRVVTIMCASILLIAAFSNLPISIQAESDAEVAIKAAQAAAEQARKAADAAKKAADDEKKAADEAAAKPSGGFKTDADKAADAAAAAAEEAAAAADKALAEAQRQRDEAAEAEAAAKKADNKDTAKNDEAAKQQKEANDAAAQAKKAEDEAKKKEKEADEADKKAAASDKEWATLIANDPESKRVRRVKRKRARALRRAARRAREEAERALAIAEKLLEEQTKRKGEKTAATLELEKKIKELKDQLAQLFKSETVPIPGNFLPPGNDQTTQTRTGNGLHTVNFDTTNGRVVVNLPDDMAAGDTISGTVVAEPGGQTADERAKNMGVLSGFVIDIQVPNKPDGTSNPKVTAKVTAAPNMITFSLPPSSTPARTSRQQDVITITNVGELSSGTTTVPYEIEWLSLQGATPLNTFKIPTIGQQGNPIVISGPFQLNEGSTIMYGPPGASVQDFEKNTENVSGGFGLINPIAKSPRRWVVEAPANVTGPIELYVKQGNNQTTGKYRNVGVNLTAPKTSLRKGEQTTLTVDVSGLEGITAPVPLTLTCTGVITMEGGVYQPLVIQPSQVGPDGHYSTTRGITGVQAGGWGATATVVTQRFNVCLQDDAIPRRRILWNSINGEYVFVNPFPPKPLDQSPQTGSTDPPPLTGTGKMIMKGCIITLQHNAPDRRVFSRLDTCTNTGSATVETVLPKEEFTITDRSTTDNTCSMQ